VNERARSAVDSLMRAPTCSNIPDPALPLRRVAAVALIVLLAGCASRTRAPVEDRAAGPGRPVTSATSVPPTPGAASATEPDWRPSTYTVKRGDTLFQIALDHGLDYRELATWNAIDNVNMIRVGQSLRLTPPGESAAAAGGVTTAPLKSAPAIVETRPAAPSAAAPAIATAPAAARNSDNYKSSPKALKEPYSEQAMKDIAKAATAPPETVAMVAPVVAAPKVEPKPELPRAPPVDLEDDDKLDWIWPTKGHVVGAFSETANLKGIDIAGTAGQPVLASSSGTVVYAGSGLRGYGKLIIVKHNRTYLSAYAHNRDILVKEGQQVTKGQKIAEMGNSDTTEVKLHFEIRRLGKPMDPARYLPPA